MKYSSKLIFCAAASVLTALNVYGGTSSKIDASAVATEQKVSQEITANDPPLITVNPMVLFEDFELPANWNGSNAPSGWSVVDSGYGNGVWDNFDWFRASTWSGWGAQVNGSTSNYYNNDHLISPAVDFSSATACSLKIEHHYDDYTTLSDSAIILLSDDGGISWPETVMVFAGIDYGSLSVPDTVFIDISGFAQGKDLVQASFTYIKRSTTQAGLWIVDNIEFRADGSLIISEDFEGIWGSFGNNPPNNWTIIDGFDALWDFNDWHQDASLDGWGKVARVYWPPLEIQSDWLISPSMDFSQGANLVTLAFKQYYNDKTGNTDTARVYISSDGGAVWNLIDIYTSDRGSPSNPHYASYDITSYASYFNDVKFGFKYTGNQDLYWIIDSVSVQRQVNDVGVLSILAPPSMVIQGYSWFVRAQVRNYGTHQSTFDTVFDIMDSTGTLVYSDTQSVANLGAEAEQTVYFSNWLVDEPNNYTMSCYTLLEDDINSQNDSSAATTYAYPHRGASDGYVQGWYYRDNITGGGQNFAWIDISSIGTPISFADDDDGNSGFIDMGINFDYFGINYSRIAVCTNGWLSFEDSISVDASPISIPHSDGPGAMVAPLWDDLTMAGGIVRTYSDIAENRFFVQFDSCEYKSQPSGTSDFIMQVIFDADDNTIKFQYRYFKSFSESDVLIGIENQTETLGLAYNNNGEIGQTPLPGLAVTYYYIEPFHDPGITGILSPQFYQHIDSSFAPQIEIGNFGTETDTLEAYFSIFDPTLTLVYSDTAEIVGLEPASNDTIDFISYVPVQLGDYLCRAVINETLDTLAGNDTLYFQFIVDIHDGVGGPDGGSYYWIDNTVTDTSAPVFNWIDITGDGQLISVWDHGNSDDGITDLIPMNLTSGFDFYDLNCDSICISTNGWISFYGYPSSYPNNMILPFPGSAPELAIFPCWADQRSGASGQVYYKYDSGGNRFIVSWINWEFVSSPVSPRNFQLILDGNDNSILIQYAEIESGQYSSDITVGIQNYNGEFGLCYFYDDNPYFNKPYENLAVKFFCYRYNHDVGPAMITSPETYVVNGESPPIVLSVFNFGLNTESFTVSVSDNFGYYSTQSVSYLPPQATSNLTFAGWNINSTCSEYILQVVTELAIDENTGNDTLFWTFKSIDSVNVEFVYDDGTSANAIRFLKPDNIIASEFDLSFGNALLQAVAYKFTNLDEFPDWPDSDRDSVRLAIFTDDDSNGFPDSLPILEKILLPEDHGWTTWNIACDTAVYLDCESFWAGWSFLDSLKPEGLLIDFRTDFWPSKWVRINGAWSLGNIFPGDLMIRAYLSADSSTAPHLVLGTNLIEASSLPDSNIVDSTYIVNTGTICDLDYSITIIQAVPPDISEATENKSLASNCRLVNKDFRASMDSPKHFDLFDGYNIWDVSIETDNSGGPDEFGYIWVDSDQPDGPDFFWQDIVSVGTEIETWDHGSSWDGFTDPIDMGMTFEFYGIIYSSVVVTTYGLISFEPQIFPYSYNTSIPDWGDPNNMIAINWDILRGDINGRCFYYYNESAGTFTISWINWTYALDPDRDISFQIILVSNSGEIFLQYDGSDFLDAMTIGIENSAGDIGLQVAYNENYIHDNLAILFSPPITWLSTSLEPGVLAPSDPPLWFNIIMDASQLEPGIHNGRIIINSNDPLGTLNSIIDVEFTVEAICDFYIPGDVNGSNSANGLDVIFMVNHFKGGDPPYFECPACEDLGGSRYVSGDVNGSCSFNGLDVTYFVNFLKGIGSALTYCSQCAPIGGLNIKAGIDTGSRNKSDKVIKINGSGNSLTKQLLENQR